MDTPFINSEYLDTRFEKYKKVLDSGDETLKKDTLEELYKSFAMLNQEEQKYANIFLHDVQRGDVVLEKGKSFRDYINEYRLRDKEKEINEFVKAFGIDEAMLRNMLSLGLKEDNINEFGRLTALEDTIDISKAQSYFEKKEGTDLSIPKVHRKISTLLRQFILDGGFKI